MATNAPPYQSVLAVRENQAFQLGVTDTFLGLYNPTTGEYLGSEAQAYDYKTTVLRGCTQIAFGAYIDLACYPVNVFASVLIPIGG